jgi:hypothetical protein
MEGHRPASEEHVMSGIVGNHLYAHDGEDLGEIVDVVGATGPDMTPSWVTVKTGWFSQRLVPFGTVEDRARQLVTSCSAVAVKNAPKVPTHFEPAGDDLDQLRSYYGLRPETA